MVRDQSNATFVLLLTYLHVVYLHPVLNFFQLYLLDYLLYLVVLLRLSTSQTPPPCCLWWVPVWKNRPSHEV